LSVPQKLIQKQAQNKINYLLFISSNLDNCEDVEIQRTLINIKTELLRYGVNGEKVIKAYLDHEKDEVRLKIYIPYFVNQIASGVNYNCETGKVIFYAGNLNVRMMNFRFYLKYDLHTTAPRFPREQLSQIVNSPMIEIKEGEYKEVTLGLPKLKRSDINMKTKKIFLLNPKKVENITLLILPWVFLNLLLTTRRKKTK